MTEREEQEMHELAKQLEKLTRESPWEAMRYAAIGHTMERLAEYSAVSEHTPEKVKRVVLALARRSAGYANDTEIVEVLKWAESIFGSTRTEQVP